MHIIYDENGNPVSHGHEHEHHHDHEHTHDHEHHHDHDHAACDAQSCESGCNGCQDKTAALIDYMLKHNEHHAAELDQLADKFQADGKAAAADQIRKAVDEFKKGNLYLGLALATVKEQ